jgi:hypothetical protein
MSDATAHLPAGQASGPPVPPRPTSTDRETARRDRVQQIRDAAITRSELGILWQCRRDLIGQHVVWWYDRDRGVMREFTADSLDLAIERARRAAG